LTLSDGRFPRRIGPIKKGQQRWSCRLQRRTNTDGTEASEREELAIPLSGGRHGSARPTGSA